MPKFSDLPHQDLAKAVARMTASKTDYEVDLDNITTYCAACGICQARDWRRQYDLRCKWCRAHYRCDTGQDEYFQVEED